MIERINDTINNKAMVVFNVFLFLQPILDMLIGVFSTSNIVSLVTSTLKILFMFFAIYYICIIKKKSFKYIALIFLYSIAFILTNILFKENGNILTELKILSKNIFLPISLLFVINVFKENDFNIKKLNIILLIYVALIFFPNILNIGFDSYSYSKLGSVGVFYSANAIGSIISILLPIFIANLVINKNKSKLILFLIINVYILVGIGTKAPILCAGIVVIYYLVLSVIKCVKNKKYSKLLLMLFIILVFILLAIKLLPLTAFYKNLIIHLDFLKIDSFWDLLTFKNLDHFIFSSRLSFFKDSFEVFINSSIFQKLFGIGYVIEGSLFKTSEMDYLVTFIHQGILGFIILYFEYFKSLFMVFKVYLNKIKIKFMDIKQSAIILSLIISILCALFAGHVLETPSVCIFVSTIIGITYKEFIIDNK